jgi:hypothetical protein
MTIAAARQASASRYPLRVRPRATRKPIPVPATAVMAQCEPSPEARRSSHELVTAWAGSVAPDCAMLSSP